MFKSKERITKPSSDEAIPSIGRQRVYAIGDIHGRRDLLDQLLEKIDADAQGDSYQLIFLGDYVDRGPDSWGVIERLVCLRQSRPSTIFLKGNHEQALIDFIADPKASEAWLDWGGLETLQSYGVENIRGRSLEQVRDQLSELMPDAHFRFLLDLSLSYARGHYFFVHAGVNPTRSLQSQRESDLLWIREPFLSAKNGLKTDKIIVHGHTPTAQPEDLGWRINIDTGAFASGMLTALCLQTTQRSFITS